MTRARVISKPERTESGASGFTGLPPSIEEETYRSAAKHVHELPSTPAVPARPPPNTQAGNTYCSWSGSSMEKATSSVEVWFRLSSDAWRGPWLSWLAAVATCRHPTKSA
jgi:hypothetical protein